MRKIIAAINMTLDGFCDHTAGIPDEELHQHYTDLLQNGSIILYGRKTYELMKYWQAVLKNPTGNKGMDEFAIAIDNIPKIVFSRTLKNPEWESAKLATKSLEEEAIQLKQSGDGSGKPILVGSPGLIVSLLKLSLIDELQVCIHPVIAGGGLPLFKDINESLHLKLLTTKTFSSGAQVLSYAPH
jgi:dihydrofolate reductase